MNGEKIVLSLPVSTHSRPKAAGLSCGFSVLWKYRFNTQPPEGGWGWVG